MGFMSNEVAKLENLSLQDLPRLERLRKAHFESRAEICLELARNSTEFFKQHELDGDPPEVTAGKLYHHIMSRKQPVIADESLLAGTTTTRPKGVVLYPHFLSLTIWPELETIGRRQKNPFAISKADREELNATIFPFWMERTIQEVARKDHAVVGATPESQRVMERIVFFLASKAYCISHTIPGYAIVLEKGLQGVIDEACQREKALGLYEQAIEARPDDFQAPLLMAQIYEDLGRKADAEAARRRGIELARQHLEWNPDDARATYMLANGLAALGDAREGSRWADRARAMRPDDGMVLYNCGCVYALAGEAENALECLEEAVRYGLTQRGWYENDSNLDPLRGWARFQELLAKLQ